MSTPQRSRYPRPLKATQTFPGGSSGSGQGGPAHGSTSPSSTNASTNTAASVPVCAGHSQAAVLKNGQSSPPPVGNGVRRSLSSPERRSPVSCSRKDGVGDASTDGRFNPRRSNSLGSLSEPDCYMNSLWPRLAVSASQCDSEEPLTGSDTELNFFSHKRSNSCSSDDRLKVNKGGAPVLKNGVVSSAHTRKSVEGLNQEVSSALEGNPILLVETTPPDGHVAPVQDLLGRASIGTQTPPFSLNSVAGGVSQSAQTPSPFPGPAPLPASPSATHTTAHTSTTSDSTHSGTNGSSPASFQHPPSPKPSFAREPPDGAERCIIKVETSVQKEGFIPRGPDKSKGTIVFNKGTAFAPPLLTAQNLQPVV